jgi:hypothetical protein
MKAPAVWQGFLLGSALFALEEILQTRKEDSAVCPGMLLESFNLILFPNCAMIVSCYNHRHLPEKI